jgi:tetratricopeptide (TPR) repeat protein
LRLVHLRDPGRKKIWTRVASAEMRLRRYDDAIRDFRKAIEAEPFDAFAHAELGGMYLTVHKPQLAEPELKKAVEIEPLNHRAHYLLGWYYAVSQKDPAAAVPELEKALATVEGFDDETEIRERLTDSYFKLKQFDKGVESLKRSVESAPNPATWNNAAYKLAVNGLSLDLAQEYANSALKAIYEYLDQVEPASSMRTSDMVFMAQLALTWDTLGWIHYKLGHFDLAEKYTRAAWVLSQNRESAEHLGEIYEKLNKPSEAERFYAMSAMPSFAGNPAAPPDPGRVRLVQMLGRQRAEQLISAKAGEPSQLRTLHLGNIAPAGSRGEFRFVIAPGPKLVSIQSADGDSPLTEQLRKQEQRIAASVLFPENMPQKVVRQALVMCTPYSKSCDLVFMTSDMPSNRRALAQGSE